MALSDAVAAQVLGELHILTKNIEDQAKRVEKLASTVIEAAKQVNACKTVLHSQNEAVLMQRANEITEAISELKGVEGALQHAAREQANAAISSLVSDLKSVSDKQLNRHVEAMKQFSAARNVYEDISLNMKFALVAFGLIFVVAMGGAFYAGLTVGSSTTEKTESHVGSRPFINQK